MNKKKLNILSKFRLLNKKKKTVIVIVIMSALTLLSGLSVFAYQVYLENINPKDNFHNEPCEGICPMPSIDKPVIYLYPTKTENIKVRLDYSGELISTYPLYNSKIKGWQVLASPDGTLKNRDDGKEYSYLFWEGKSNVNFSNFKDGFIVKGTDTREFLQNKLKLLGLKAKEYNEMIVFWLPKMEVNKYNLIHFAGEEYTDIAKLYITPKPDSVLRVFMVFKALDKYQYITEQRLNTFDRKGFSVVEWGGTEIK